MSMIFSCCHNSIGVMFQGLAVIYIAEALSDSKDNWTVEITRQQVIEKEIDNSTWSVIQAWLKLNATKCKVIAMCVGCFVFGVFGGVSFDEWTILKAMDMTLSTLTCSGYLGLPEEAASWKLIVLAIYTNIGVPLLAISLGELLPHDISLLWCSSCWTLAPIYICLSLCMYLSTLPPRAHWCSRVRCSYRCPHQHIHGVPR